MDLDIIFLRNKGEYLSKVEIFKCLLLQFLSSFQVIRNNIMALRHP